MNTSSMNNIETYRVWSFRIQNSPH